MSGPSDRRSHDAVAFEPDDGVAVALRAVAAGETILVRTPSGSTEIEAREDIPRFFKVAIRNIAVAEPIRKHGQAIGIATCAIPLGAVVHVHNLCSLRAQGGAAVKDPESA